MSSLILRKSSARQKKLIISALQKVTPLYLYPGLGIQFRAHSFDKTRYVTDYIKKNEDRKIIPQI